MNGDTLADVVLPRTIKGSGSATFSYRVPPHLLVSLRAGHLVWVPLQNQLLQGIVVQLQEQTTSSPHTIRDMVALADPEAVIPPHGLAVAQWVAATYQATLYESLALWLPPGIRQQAVITWRVTPSGLAADLGTLPDDERAVLYYVRKHGETTETTMQQVMRGSIGKLRDLCTLLAQRGLLERATRVAVPHVRPRTERLVELRVVPSESESLLASLARSPRQQRIVAWLVAHAIEGQPIPPGELAAATGATLAQVRVLEKKGILALHTREVRRDPLAAVAHLSATCEREEGTPPLTAGQRQVWESLEAALETLRPNRADEVSGSPHPPAFLLHGVTGSGKTELYLRAVARAIRLGRQALILVPEIALTTQLVRRFAARFPGQLAVLHSRLSPGERYDEWRRVRRGEASIVIGSRSAVFAPLPHPGLLIVDEEHEPGYKSSSSPHYHARDVVLHLAQVTGSVVVLGSATPSIESYRAAQRGHMTLLELSERVGRVVGNDGLPHAHILPMPHVRLVDMRRELDEDNRSIFSRPLQAALTTALERDEQAILFLNRRGAATFVMCRDCGHIITCPSCGNSLVLHYHYQPEETGKPTAYPAREHPTIATLMCHLCSYRTILPTCCPRCLSARIKSFGIGTQRVEQEVQQMFPHATPIRWDRDSTTGKDAHNRILDQFLRHEANVLIGTQMIAKGLDLPLVSVVGVVAADTGLYLPDFRSGERTFQLLTQVAGRAGRRTAGARVIIQTYTPEHYALRAAQEHNYHAFYQQEISFRRQTGYPPFGRLVRFLFLGSSRETCQRAADSLASRLHDTIKRHHLYGWGVIGPAPAFLQRQRGRWRWHLLLHLPREPYGDTSALASLLADLGPLHGWVIDVDPVHVL